MNLGMSVEQARELRRRLKVAHPHRHGPLHHLDAGTYYPVCYVDGTLGIERADTSGAVLHVEDDATTDDGSRRLPDSDSSIS